MTTYRASCHCGAVAFEVDGAIDAGLACNCSICSRKGSLLWFVPRAQVRFATPDDAAGTYLFNQHRIRHRFCRRCGIHTHGEADDPKGVPTIAVNLRCVEGLDLDAVPVQRFDGRAL